jgi:hypothetical protein
VLDARAKLRNQFHENLPKKVSVNQVVIFLPGLLLFSLRYKSKPLTDACRRAPENRTCPSAGIAPLATPAL